MPTNNTGKQKMASRVRKIMEHTTRYCIDGRSRLIADAGLSRSEITRLLPGDCNPSYRVVVAVIEALEKALGRRLESRDVFSYSAKFLTPTVCELVGCRGCPDCKPYAGPSRIPARRDEAKAYRLPEYQLTFPKKEHE